MSGVLTRWCVTMSLVLTGLLVLAAPAEAATVRYASPTGTSGQSCATPATACNIEKAFNDAVLDDEIVLAPGTYTPAAELANDAIGLSLHGTPGQSRPVLVVSSNNGLLMNGSGAEVADLTIQHSGAGYALYALSRNAQVSRVEVRSSGAAACYAGTSGVFRDSLCVSTGTNGYAVRLGFSSNSSTPSVLQVRNVTAVATGPGSVGISTSAGQDANSTLEARNVVASGETDVVTAVSGNASSTVVLSYSNYDTVNTSGGGSVTPPGTGTNQTAAPVFADTTSYHQTRTSPTVDAGTADAATGSLDLDGDARPQGAAIDIGADELVPDTMSPLTTLGKHPRKHTTKKRARFTFSSNEPGSTFVCRLDKRKPKPCTSPFRKRLGKLGKHTFRVYAVDSWGNADPTPVRFVWRIKPKDG